MSLISLNLICRAGVWAGALFTVATSHAQWSHNPAVNTPISTGGSDQNQAKIIATADGGAYIVWLDGIGTGWDTRLQRIDARGVKQWPGNGVLVADTAFSSTQDYGFALDADGNALIAYRDDNNSGAPVQIKIQKIDANGNLLWGVGGAQVSAVSGGNSPRCCATSDGGAVVAWSENASVRVQKVDAKGAVQWTAGGMIDTPAAGIYFISDIASDESGGALTLYHHQTGNFSSPRHLKMQRWASADGAKLWNAGTALAIWDGGSIQLGNFPALVPDGAGGAIVAWYNTGGARNAHVQHIDVNGVELFAHNGMTIANDIAGRIRISAAASYDAATGDIYLIAEESDAAPQGNYNVRLQRIDNRGTRAWGGNGISLLAPNANHPSFVQAKALANSAGAIFGWYQGPLNNVNVRAARLDSQGSFAWTPSVIDVSSAASNKARLWSTANSAGDRMFFTWGDSRSDGNDIYAQAVNLNGSLGTPGDVNDDGLVNVDDLLGVINAWGDACAPFCAADVAPAPAGDGLVNVDDLLAVINNWG